MRVAADLQRPFDVNWSMRKATDALQLPRTVNPPAHWQTAGPGGGGVTHSLIWCAL